MSDLYNVHYEVFGKECVAGPYDFFNALYQMRDIEIFEGVHGVRLESAGSDEAPPSDNLNEQTQHTGRGSRDSKGGD